MDNQNHTKEPWLVAFDGYEDGKMSSCITTMSDGIASRLPTNQFNDQRIVACVNALAGVEDPEAFMRDVRELESEVAEHNTAFDLRWKADMRAIKRWQDETGKELTWPDHADLCVWLLGELATARNEALEEAAKAAHTYGIDAPTTAFDRGIEGGGRISARKIRALKTEQGEG